MTVQVCKKLMLLEKSKFSDNFFSSEQQQPKCLQWSLRTATLLIVVCVHVALQWTGDLSCLRPMTAGTDIRNSAWRMKQLSKMKG